nr:MAG TPA: hypothetical protein [Microviridae sp.]
MSNKTTMILTFLVSTIVPFIQEVVDFIAALKSGSTLKDVARAVNSDIQNSEIAKAAVTVSQVKQSENTSKTNGFAPVSRFFGDWRSK